MATHTIEFSEETEELLARTLSSGDYPSAEVAISEGLRLIESRRDFEAAKLAHLRRLLDKSRENYEAGNYVGINSREELGAFTKGILEKLRETRRAEYPHQ